MESVKGEYIRLNTAWYGEANLINRKDGLVDDISIIPATGGEIVVEWRNIQDVGLCPCLRVFDDQWAALFGNAELVDMFKTVSDQNLQPEEFCDLLTHMGYVDATPLFPPDYKITKKMPKVAK